MIHFVGAGPGSADLITVRGQRLLSQADAVIYAGSLVNPALLSVCKQDCRILDSASMTLEEVVAVMLEEQALGHELVRLHTGDPSLYGAIREQMDILDEHGVSYDVTPGVSSMCAAASALQAEYTLPTVSQSVIITRMEGRTPVPQGEKLAALASHGCTMVLFLSAALIESVRDELIAGGYSPSTPAAIVYKASWPDERVIRCSVGSLPEAAREAGINKTALITVGGFLGSSYERSKLYDPAFSHGFRESSV